MITIKFFATIKQKIGRELIEITIDQPMSIGSVIKTLESDIPEIGKTIADTRSLVAVNHEFATTDTIVKDGDEIAFIPPMSGGAQLVRIQEKDFSVEEEIGRAHV